VLFSRFFETLGAKNTEHTEVFCAQEHGIYNVFATGNKNHGICSVFETSPSKNTSIYAIFDFQHVARSSFYMQKVQQHCNLRGFLLLERT